MRILKIIIAFTLVLSSFRAFSSCNYAELDSLAASEAIIHLTNCDSIDNMYVHEIKLGDSYFRNNELAKAILHYENARSLNTIDPALNDNLELAYESTLNGAKTLIIGDLNSKKHLVSSPHLRDYWSILSLLLLVLVIYLLLSQKFKYGLASKFFMPLLAISILVLGITAYSFSQDITVGIVMVNDVAVYESTSGTTPAVSVLNAGYKLEILELTADWAYVNLATNQKVWVDKSSIELVSN